MKVVQINTECGRGSTGKITVAISKTLSNHNIENYVFYSGNHRSNYPFGIQIGNKLCIRIHQVLSRIFGDQGWHSYFSTKKLIRKLKQIDPDYIHLHNIHGYYLHMGVLFRYLKRCDKKIIWTLHDCWSFTGHCTHFSLENCNKWKDICCDCVNIKKYPYSFFFDRSTELFKRKKKLFTGINELIIVTPSEWLATLVRESFLKDYTIKVIHNGIDLNTFKPVKYREEYRFDGKFVILGVASVWNLSKGIDVFISLAKELNQDIFQIVLVGTDAETEKMIPDSIVCINRTQNQNELAELYSRADLFLNPTKEDTYPTVNMEAMACGTAVMTYNTGGSVESITDESGIIIKSNTINETINAIKRYYENPNKKNKQLILEHAKSFNQDNCFSLYYDLYK